MYDFIYLFIILERPFFILLKKPFKVSLLLDCHCFVVIFYIFWLDTDWFDGLHTFTRNICQKSWLGGWFMPQKKSYFSLQLPMGWWIFGLDLALHGDIDVYQFEFFSKLARKMVYIYIYMFTC